MIAARTIEPRRASELDIVDIDPLADPRWSQLLRLDAAGLFHAPPWLRALSDAYGFEPRAYLAVDPQGVPQGGVAYCKVADALGPRVLSLPFSDACDPLLASDKAWPALFAALQAHGLPLHLRCLNEQEPAADTQLSIAKRARWHTLALGAGLDAVWSGFEGGARRAIRKAERAGVVVRPIAGPTAVEDFRRMHVALRKRKYRLLAQPPAFFEAIARRFGEIDGWFPLGAYVGDRLVAATIYLRWGDTLYYKFNASSLDALEERPNNLLVWAGIALARSLDCRKLDLGPSDDDQPGLIRFKRQFGAAERELKFLRYVPPEWRDDRAAELRGLLGELTRTLTAPDVPDEVAGRAGALLYRLFA
jgi:CelD/BcsL family acetyltransferase involved in cellulose biosynthesis